MARLDRLGPAKEAAQFGRCPSGDEEISVHAKRGNVGGSHTLGCCIAETALAGWGGRIRITNVGSKIGL